MPSQYIKEAKAKMEKSIEAFQHELTTIRTGRANVSLLDGIEVDVYGSRMKLQQVGNISAPDARMLTITPWDKKQIALIEKAILASPLELTPSNDGKIIRIPLPALTGQRRKDLVKLISKHAEEAKVAIRNLRRHAVEEIKKAQKDGEIPEDDAHKLTTEAQKVTDEFIERVDKAFKHKEDEIMEV